MRCEYLYNFVSDICDANICVTSLATYAMRISVWRRRVRWEYVYHVVCEYVYDNVCDVVCGVENAHRLWWECVYDIVCDICDENICMTSSCVMKVCVRHRLRHIRCEYVYGIVREYVYDFICDVVCAVENRVRRRLRPRECSSYAMRICVWGGYD